MRTTGWRPAVEFWKMLNRASTIILGMSVLVAGVGVYADKASGADFSGTAAALWIVRLRAASGVERSSVG